MKKILCPLPGLIGLCLLEAFRERYTLRTTEYGIRSEKLGGLRQEARLVLLSDLHDIACGKKNERLFRRIVSARPDAVLLAGDMITAARGKDHTATGAFIAQLAKRYPTFYALGNHESKCLKNAARYRDNIPAFFKRLRNAGVVLLDNESRVISLHGQAFRISGLTLPPSVYQRSRRQKPLSGADIQKRLGAASQTAYQILIAHSPAPRKAYRDWGADLSVCGHVHGGVVCLFGHIGLITPQLRLLDPYARGCFPNGRGHLAVSAGLGTHAIPLRLMNPPEAVLLRLQKGR